MGVVHIRMAANRRTFTDVQGTVLSAHKESTTEDKMSFYDSWSELYEQDVMILDYRAPVLAAESLAAVIHENRDKVLVLDVACGTGLVAKQVVNYSYDAVVIVGALSGGQVPPAILPELHRVTKTGGFVCMTTRNNTSNRLYKKQLQAVIEEMEQNRLWERVTVQEIEHWEKATTEAEQGSTYISGIIYLYRKLRSYD
ncbi:methyltransferase-like protein 27 isoform X3 [Rhincodon typus]|uniref:methyltransferase-like protein 27 isoform X3 n=1 Tax=Rhincodon typus TaxID=259920 RepID=UPI00202DFE86|nr:methyltransferase-like protein 27 isoform X3 [Rhincodon typus]